MANDTAITIENVSKYYKLYNSPKDRLKEVLNPFGKKLHRDFYALRNISFDVRRGEVLGIVGRNGAGKSTLLKILAGVLLPSSGKVITNGSISALLEVQSGLNPEFTGLENITFQGTMLGFSREEMHKKLDEIIAFADIGEFIQQPVKTYSSGMKARLGFAIAVNVEPDILITDEVLAVGDDLFKRKCYARMNHFVKAGKTIILVSHSVRTIKELCRRAILLDRGELILEGPARLVTTQHQCLLFTRPANFLNVRNEIIGMNQDEELKRIIYEEILQGEVQQQETAETHQEKIAKEENTFESIRPQPFYIPDFIPKSTVVQKNFDVDIYDVHIRTLDGKRVNALVMNEEYAYSYKVRFNVEIENVNITIAISSPKGIGLGWYTYPGINQYIEEVFSKGTIYEVQCYFMCKLLPGTYFISVNIAYYENGKFYILHKIRDATVFKVQEIPNIKQGGFFNFEQKIDIVKLH